MKNPVCRMLGLFLLPVTAGMADNVITLKSEWPLLFADDSGIQSKSGVTRTVHAAKTVPVPVLCPDRPWEGCRVYVYGSVYRDPASHIFRLWYGSGGTVLYAVSNDGLHWDKPALNLYASSGNIKANNIVYRLHSPSVLFDLRERDPEKRCKMIGSQFFRDRSTGKVDKRRTGYYTATSPDGLRWKEVSPAPALSHWDTVTLTQDPRTGDYLAYHKRHTEFRGYNRRIVWLSRSRDFQVWSEPEIVFGPDAEDDAWATSPGQRTEVYNMSVLPHAGGFIGFPTMFRVTAANRPDMGPDQSPDDGPINVQLVTSPDGQTWSRTAPRTVVIDNGAAGAFDAGCILGVSSTAVQVGDETWLYYTGVNTTHGGPMPPKRMSLGRAVWRRDGFISLDAAGKGRVQTRPLRLTSPLLIVNADASHGALRIGICNVDGTPIHGLSVQECVPLQANDTQYAVRWTSGVCPPVSRAVRVILNMEKCRIFSLSVHPSSTTTGACP